MKTEQERRRLYHNMDAEEIIAIMPDDELEMNAQKGGILAKIELKKRRALANLHPTIESRELDIGV